MTEDHPARQVLERFVLGQLGTAEMHRVSQHILEGCPACRQTTSSFWERSGEGALLPRSTPQEAGRDAFDKAIDRVFRVILSLETEAVRERSYGRELFSELMHHPQARQHLLVSNSTRFKCRALCEILLEQAHEEGFQEPARSVELAKLAVEVSNGLLEVDAGDGVEGLRSRAWAQLGNAFRISSDRVNAEQAFKHATALLDSGRVSPMETARVLDLEASLKRDQRRFAEATGLMDRVISIYRKLGQRSLLGRALKQKSMICGESGDLSGEITLLKRALELLSLEEEPRTFLAARHNLISALCENGQPREAFVLLFHTRPLYLKLGDRMNLLRLRWLEGAVARGLQRLEQAVVAFREVRESFLELGIDYDAALATLDLAEAFALQGRSTDARRLAEEMFDVFQLRNLHREALAALAFLQQAARREQAELVLVRKVARFLKQARNHPDLQFSGPSF